MWIVEELYLLFQINEKFYNITRTNDEQPVYQLHKAKKIISRASLEVIGNFTALSKSSLLFNAYSQLKFSLPDPLHCYASVDPRSGNVIFAYLTFSMFALNLTISVPKQKLQWQTPNHFHLWH